MIQVSEEKFEAMKRVVEAARAFVSVVREPVDVQLQQQMTRVSALLEFDRVTSQEQSQ